MAKKPVDKAVFDPDDDLLPEDDIPSIPVAEPLPEPAVVSGIAVKRAVPVSFTIAAEDGTIQTAEGEMAYHAGDYLMTDHTGDGRRWPVDPAYFERHYVLGDKQPDWTDVKAALGSGYESRNPNFTAGGTAYVRVFCPECSQPMFFSVETGTQLTIKDGERKLKPTFKATAKVHACHQTVAELTEDDEDEEAIPPVPSREGFCPCTDCDPHCDNPAVSADGVEAPSLCVPCSNDDHVVPDAEDEEGTDVDG
jgi:hypothetical protein